MTTGSILTDRSTPYNPPGGCGSGFIGEKISRSWSGADYPPGSKRDPFVYRQSLDKIRRADGSVEWRRYIAPGHPPKRVSREDHPYSANIIREVDVPLLWSSSIVDPVRPGTVNTCFGGYSSPSPLVSWTDNDTIQLVSKLRTAIAGSDFNAAVFLAEGSEALTMIAQNATKIYEMYRAIRKGNFLQATAVLGVSNRGRRRFHQPGNWSDNLLELQYGWRPLLSDVYGGAEFLAHQLNSPLVKTYKVGKKIPRPRSTFTWETTSPSICGPESYDGFSGRSIIARISEVNVAQLSGLLNPEVVLWELVPFSFVADWFIPIGSWLSSRGLASSLTGTFVTSYLERKTVHGLVGRSGWIISNASAYTFERVFAGRTVSSSLDVPMPGFKPLGKVASWEHCLNAVALLTSMKT
jgi:hypothetical protein